MSKNVKKFRPRNSFEFANAPAIIESYRGTYAGDIELLMEILTTKRPHKSKSETKFCRDFLDIYTEMEIDGFGNRIVNIEGDGDSICYTSHVDTVHYSGGTQGIRKSRDIITLSRKSKSNCLGADDGAGIWLMLEMINQKKPGLYIFHRGEECGGLGSDFIATHTPKILDGIDAVISLDRFGYESVITHQGDLTSSNQFAQSLANALEIDSLKPDDTGLFTDSANYADLIGECSNLSVGYFGHHGAAECLDLGFLCVLRDKLIKLDTSKLELYRMPGESEWYQYTSNVPKTYYGGIEIEDSDFDAKWNFELDSDSGIATASYCNAGIDDSLPWDEENISFEAKYELEALAKCFAKYPEICAKIVQDFGVSIDEIYQGIYDKIGTFPDGY